MDDEALGATSMGDGRGERECIRNASGYAAREARLGESLACRGRGGRLGREGDAGGGRAAWGGKLVSRIPLLM